MFEFNREQYQEEINQLNGFIEAHRDMPGSLMPVLQEAQEIIGYLPREIIEDISESLQIPTSKIYGVATFYSQFTFIPKGENEISVCMGTACYVKGAQDILDEFENQLGIKKGETTPDRKFSIIETRCVGDCAIAPIVTINGKNHGRYAKAKVAETIKELSGKEGQ